MHSANGRDARIPLPPVCECGHAACKWSHDPEPLSVSVARMCAGETIAYMEERLGMDPPVAPRPGYGYLQRMETVVDATGVLVGDGLKAITACDPHGSAYPRFTSLTALIRRLWGQSAVLVFRIRHLARLMPRWSLDRCTRNTSGGTSLKEMVESVEAIGDQVHDRLADLIAEHHLVHCGNGVRCGRIVIGAANEMREHVERSLPVRCYESWCSVRYCNEACRAESASEHHAFVWPGADALSECPGYTDPMEPD